MEPEKFKEVNVNTPIRVRSCIDWSEHSTHARTQMPHFTFCQSYINTYRASSNSTLTQLVKIDSSLIQTWYKVITMKQRIFNTDSMPIQRCVPWSPLIFVIKYNFSRTFNAENIYINMFNISLSLFEVHNWINLPIDGYVYQTAEKYLILIASMFGQSSRK